jgi:ABC-type sugar transport system ATPase subunit
MDALLQMKGISKVFSGVKSLDNVDFDLRPGEIHALLGENGAGKSTLLKILYGIYQKTSGDIYFKGEKVDISSPRLAQQLGISMIHQELQGINELNITQNLLLGAEVTRGGVIRWSKMHEQAKNSLKDSAFNWTFGYH